MDQILTPCEAGRILGLTSDMVRKLERSGKLPAMKTSSGRRIFWKHMVEQLAEKRAEHRRLLAAKLRVG